MADAQELEQGHKDVRAMRGSVVAVKVEASSAAGEVVKLEEVDVKMGMDAVKAVKLEEGGSALSSPSGSDSGKRTGVRKRGRARTQDRELSSIKPSEALNGWKFEPAAGGKRNRRAPTRFVEEACDHQEEVMVQQALVNSRIETHLLDSPEGIPEVPTYRPTVEEFADPIRYIESIRLEAERFGIAKVIPPEGWAPPTALDTSSPTLTFPTRRQQLDTFKQGTGYDEGRSYTFAGYRSMADTFKEDWITEHYTSKGAPAPSYEDLEREYWRMVETGADVVVEYANDLDTHVYGSGFPRRKDMVDDQGNMHTAVEGICAEACGCDLSQPEYYGNTGWNLNNLPFWPGSVLRYLQAPIKGVNIPWLYLGMLFSTFCWHNEDNFMYSVNYHHGGAPKQWYAVPGAKAEAMERVLKGFLKENFSEHPDLLSHMTTLFSPMLLQRSHVPVFRALQEAGQFIITFPKSYHAGFSYGYNVAEAVNFSSVDWVRYGREAIDRYRRFARPSVFSHERLVLTLACHVASDHWPLSALRHLVDDLHRIVEEEDGHRKRLRDMGVRCGLIEASRLPPNNLQHMDAASANYDDQRQCVSCKQTCFLSAVACECNTQAVACVLCLDRALCQCPSDRKYLLEWNEMSELRAMAAHLRVEYDRRRKATCALPVRVPVLGLDAAAARKCVA